MHGLKLVNFIDEGWRYIVVISINGSADELAAIVCLEAVNDTGIIGLDVGGEVGCKILDVATEVVLEQKDMSILSSQLLIPLVQPLLI
jgi:hypothetical protein